MCGWSIVWISRMKLRATPIATPGRMSIRTTPSRAPSAAQNSSDCARQYCVTRPESIIPDTAQITIAPRIASGRSANSPARKRIVSSAISAVTRKATGGLRADALGRRRRRRPAGDGEPLQRAGADVRGAVAQHLAVRVDGVVVLGGVALGDRERLGEPDDHDRQRAREHVDEVARRDARQRDELEARRHVSDDRHAVGRPGRTP